MEVGNKVNIIAIDFLINFQISSTVILIFFLIGTYVIFSNPRILEEEMMADPSIDIDPKLLNANGECS